MKIGFFSPYFDSLGGGERYALTLADHWSTLHNVSIFWNDRSIIPQAQKRFNLDLQKVTVVPDIFFNESFLFKLFSSSQYDLIFFVSDGSVPFSCATKNILLFQAPFAHISYPWWKRMRYSSVVVYSEFTKKNIDPIVGREAVVIYPPVDTERIVADTKKRIILSVGRFSASNTKKHDVLIKAFQQGYRKGMLNGWKLIIAGGLLAQDDVYYQTLESMIKDFPITLLPNCSFETLKDLYAEAFIYWHAAGYNQTDPTKMEHFGITTVEAMAGGCIPIVFNAGGQPEIVTHKENGFLWNTKDECLKFTEEAIHSLKIQKIMQKAAIARSKAFSLDIFYRKFDTLLQDL